MLLCVIPARGKSKRIPGKNTKIFCGKPIIAYSIETAHKSKLFHRIVVSTDDEETAKISKKFGAEVPFMRPAKLADDLTGVTQVVKHALEWFMDKGASINYVCCISATAPLLQVEVLKQGFQKLKEENRNIEYVFPVTRFGFPIQRALKLKKEGAVEPFFPEHISSRSQDLVPAFHDAGQFYWGRAEAYLKEHEPLNSSSIGLILPRYLVQDIDDKEDWRQAELLYEFSRGARSGKE